MVHKYHIMVSFHITIQHTSQSYNHENNQITYVSISQSYNNNENIIRAYFRDFMGTILIFYVLNSNVE